MKNITVGIIGLGRIGKVHLESLVYRLPQAKVKIVTTATKVAHGFAKKLGVLHVSTNYKDIVNDPDIEAVIICSPTFTHLPYVKEIAEAGKHIFCEKPLELTIDKIKEIAACVQKHQVKMQIGFNRRFDRNFAKLHRLVQAGKIGEPHLLRLTSRDPGPPPIEYIQGSGGLFLDMTIHDFDMARFLVDSEVEEVYAKGTVLVDEAIRQAGDVDTAVVTLKFANGCMGLIDNSRKATYGYDQRAEVFGSKGMAKIGNEHHDTHLLYDKMGGHSAMHLDFFMDRYKEAYFLEMEAFIKAIQTNQPVPVGAKDALLSTAIAIAAKRSMEENRPVLLSEIL